MEEQIQFEPRQNESINSLKRSKYLKWNLATIPNNSSLKVRSKFMRKKEDEISFAFFLFQYSEVKKSI